MSFCRLVIATLNWRIDSAIYFQRKIQTIRDNLQKANETNDNVVDVERADVKFTGQHPARLAPVSSDEIRKVLVKWPSKSCGIDPMPTCLLKQCANNVLPVITTMVNKSLNGLLFQLHSNRQSSFRF
jgi:hypothetical protein